MSTLAQLHLAVIRCQYDFLSDPMVLSVLHHKGKCMVWVSLTPVLPCGFSYKVGDSVGFCLSVCGPDAYVKSGPRHAQP